MNRLLELWQQPIVYRTAIGLYVALVLALAGVIFSVNSLDVQSAAYIRADTTLEKDRIHGMRGAFHYAPTGEILDPESMHWRLVPSDAGVSDGGHRLEMVGDTAQQQWPNPTFRVPDDVSEGTYDLYLTATHEDVASLEAATRIEVRDRPTPPDAIDELRWRRQKPRDSDTGIRRPIERIEAIDIETGDDDEARTADDALEAIEDIEADEGEDIDIRQISLALAPSTGELKRGLPQTIYVRTFDTETGHPVPATLSMELTKGLISGDLQSPVRTDVRGIGSFDIQPTTGIDIQVDVQPHSDEVVDFRGDSDQVRWAEAVFELDFDAVATQYALRPSSYILSGDDEISATVDTTMPDGTFMADLYDHDGNRLLDALSLRISDGQSGVRFPVPDPDETSPIVRLQAYQSLYGTRHSWDSSHLLVVDDDSTAGLRQVAAELYEWIADHTDSAHHRALVDDDVFADLSDDELRHLLEAGLHEIHPGFESPSVLLNTRDADRESLDAWRDDIQQDLRWMMAITIVAGIIVVLYFVVIGIRRHRRDNELLRQLALDDDPPEAAEQRSERLENYAVVLQGLIVLLTLVAFALGILIMVSYL